MMICIASPTVWLRNSLKSFATSPNAMASRLPIKGEISIAPMMTATESVFRPTDAMIIAQISTHILVPVILPPDNSRSRISSGAALSSFSENIFCRIERSFSSCFLTIDIILSGYRKLYPLL